MATYLALLRLGFFNLDQTLSTEFLKDGLRLEEITSLHVTEFKVIDVDGGNDSFILLVGRWRLQLRWFAE